jgi:hypothetical protein
MEQANTQHVEQQQQHMVVQPDRSPDNTDGIVLHAGPNDYFSNDATRFADLGQQNQQQQQHQFQLQDQQQQHQQQPLPQLQEVPQQQQQQQTHQVTTSQSQFQTLPSSSSAFAPILPVRPTPCYPPSTTTFSDNGQQAQIRNFRPLTPPFPITLPQPYQQLGSSSNISALSVKIYLVTKDKANISQSTLMARKFYPATFPNKHLSNSFYTTLKDSYMADLRQTVPFKQLSQIGVRHELRNMTSTYMTIDNVQHTLTLTNPLTPEEKMIAPNPYIQNNTDYGQFIDLNISFLLRLHKPPPEAYTLTLDDRNMMGSFLDQHRSRNLNSRTSSSPIRHRVGYQTQNFQRNRDAAAARTVPRENQRREMTIRRLSPLGHPNPQNRVSTYHDKNSTS